MKAVLTISLQESYTRDNGEHYSYWHEALTYEFNNVWDAATAIREMRKGKSLKTAKYTITMTEEEEKDEAVQAPES